MNTPQLNLFDYQAGKERRDRGMARASAAQEEETPGFGLYAYQAIVSVAKRQELLHVDDVLRVFNGKPNHHNAWGQPWLRAIREGVIERTGDYKATADPLKNKHVYPIYRSLIYKPA